MIEMSVRDLVGFLALAFLAGALLVLCMAWRDIGRLAQAIVQDRMERR